MAGNNEINSEKILIKKVFKMWFRIPGYQRPYVWGTDQINDLLDDITYAMTSRPDSQYFLGAFVFQKRAAGSAPGQNYDENDLIDGQQRLITLLLLFAVMRDLTNDPQMRKTCHERVYQESNPYENEPEQIRISFEPGVRESASKFFDVFVKNLNGTQNTQQIAEFVKNNNGVSVVNMARAIETIRNFWNSGHAPNMESFLKFLSNNVLMIYVSTEDLDDAFRLFTILNNRGVQLRNSDILKSKNLGVLTDEEDKKKYAKMWEDAENALGDDFDRFLNYIRTILVKEKARLSLLNEFEDKIYDPKERDKSTGQPKPQLLKRGKETFKMVERYLENQSSLFSREHKSLFGNYQFDNLLKVMNSSLPSSDWIPPLLYYYDKFKSEKLPLFLNKLNRKFAADWICQYTPTNRINNMNNLLKVIEKSTGCDDVLTSPVFDYDKDGFMKVVESNIYGRRFALYVLLLEDYVMANHNQKMSFEKLSVEHILPQNPRSDSQWCNDFSEDDRKTWTDRIGNLVLITGNKNSSLGRLDFTEKHNRYFKDRIDCCPNSLHVFAYHSSWTLQDLQKNHEEAIQRLKTLFDIQ